MAGNQDGDHRISIHAPRVGSDAGGEAAKLQRHISIHAPRVGSDISKIRRAKSTSYFNPRSPCGERLLRAAAEAVRKLFQSTLPVWGATAEPE